MPTKKKRDRSGYVRPPRQRRLPWYPLTLTVEMVAQATVFCARCETQVMGSLGAHSNLHGAFPAVVRAEVAVYDEPQYLIPLTQASQPERPSTLQHYADAVFDLD